MLTSAVYNHDLSSSLSYISFYCTGVRVRAADRAQVEHVVEAVQPPSQSSSHLQQSQKKSTQI